MYVCEAVLDVAACVLWWRRQGSLQALCCDCPGCQCARGGANLSLVVLSTCCCAQQCLKAQPVPLSIFLQLRMTAASDDSCTAVRRQSGRRARDRRRWSCSCHSWDTTNHSCSNVTVKSCNPNAPQRQSPVLTVAAAAGVPPLRWLLLCVAIPFNERSAKYLQQVESKCHLQQQQHTLCWPSSRQHCRTHFAENSTKFWGCCRITALA